VALAQQPAPRGKRGRGVAKRGRGGTKRGRGGQTAAAAAAAAAAASKPRRSSVVRRGAKRALEDYVRELEPTQLLEHAEEITLARQVHDFIIKTQSLNDGPWLMTYDAQRLATHEKCE